jgi:hypothetical protein
MTEEKARVWLPRCVPDGYNYDCIGTKRNGDKCGDEDGKGDGDSSYAIVIAPWTGGSTMMTPKAARTMMDR